VARVLPVDGVTPDDAPGAQAIGSTAIAPSAARRFSVNEIIGVLSKGVARTEIAARPEFGFLTAWLHEMR
jgi:hypothetical protein